MSDQTLTTDTNTISEAAFSNVIATFRKALSTAANNMLLTARKKLNLGMTPEMEQAVTDLEKARMEAYLGKMTGRLENELERAIRSAEPKSKRLESWDAAIQRESTYVTAHIDAAQKRLDRMDEIATVYKESPAGAIWKLGDAKIHTPDCLAMANKAWSWPVILAVNPYNRHYGCKCHIEPLPDGFDTTQINTSVPLAVTMDAAEVSSFQVAKKAFYKAKQGSRKAEYVAMSQMEKAQRIARQDAQLGGHFINKGGKAIFIPKHRAKAVGRAARGMQTRTFKTVAKSRPTGRPQAFTPTPKPGKTARISVKTAPDGADITHKEAFDQMAALEHDVFNAKAFQAINNAEYTMGDGKTVKTELVTFLDSTKSNIDTSPHPFDAVGEGVILIDGKAYGSFRRRIYIDKDTNEFIAEHEYLGFENAGYPDGELVPGGIKYQWATDEEMQNMKGQGFAQKFGRRAETFYRVLGVSRIKTHANQDVGGYAWARSGYTFDPDEGDTAADIYNAVFTNNSFDADMRGVFFDSKFHINKYVPEGERIAFADQVLNEAVTPWDISQIGRDGTHWQYEGHDMWYGKALLMGSGWHGEKRVSPISSEQLAAMEATQDSDLSDFAKELILASHGRSDMDEYILARIIGEVHYLWTQRVQGSIPFSPALASAENSVYNQHHLDISADREADDLFYNAVNKAIRDFDTILKASVPPES